MFTDLETKICEVDCKSLRAEKARLEKAVKRCKMYEKLLGIAIIAGTLFATICIPMLINH